MLTRIAASAGLAVLIAWLSPGQSAGPPHFEVGIVKKNTSGVGFGGGSTASGQLHLSNVPLSALIEVAYGIRDSAVICNIEWVRSDRFDVVAKSPDGSGEAQIPEMLQALLTESFRLSVHKEQRAQDVFSLEVAKGGPKLKPAAAGATGTCERSVLDNGSAHAECKGVTMARLCDDLLFLAPAYFDRPVVDSTGLAGAWDFQLEWVGKARAAAGGSSVFDAVNELGLRLDSRKISAGVVVVDHVERLIDN